MAKRRHKKNKWLSPLTKKVLAVNIVSLFVLMAGLLYMDQYRKSLVNAEIESLTIQARIFADTVGELAVESVPDTNPVLLVGPARDMIRRVVPPTRVRARLYGKDGKLLIDSRVLGGRKGKTNSTVQIEDLDEANSRKNWFQQSILSIIDEVSSQPLFWRQLPAYVENSNQSASDYEEAKQAMSGNAAHAMRWLGKDEEVIISVAVPVQHYRQILGVMMVSKTSEDIEKAMALVWYSAIQVFIFALIITLLLSAYLAGALSRPIVRLAEAANRMRLAKNRQTSIPDFSARHDEIGDLSMAMRDLTTALWNRMDAIESFAADVAHEIKNPLNSLRSAVETAAKLDDPKKTKQLLQIVLDDVTRLDRLITDISEASRVDADMSKSNTRTIDVVHLIAPIVQLYSAQSRTRDITVDLFVDPTLHFYVHTIESRLVQVVRNLLDNAISFSPQGGIVGVHINGRKHEIEIAITDEGPGIPADRLEKIFDRFYTDRPRDEKFGLHSGLGLSISRQIVTAMGGNLRAENITGVDDKILGARFIITLPAAK